MDKIDLDKIQKPKGHEKYSNDEMDKCPIMQSRIKKDKEKLQIAEQNKDIEKSPKKEKKMKGGCPFMPSDKKKNPMLGAMTESFDVAYISPYQYFFEYCPLLHLTMKYKVPEKKPEKKVFDSYPIYLKHSLMIDDDENMDKVKEMEVSKRFFCYDKFREKGNKEFYKENYEKALAFYERAFHCFRWLTYKPPKDEDEEEEKEEKKSEEEENQNEEITEQEEEEAKRQEEDKKLLDKMNTDMTDKEKEEVDQYIQSMKKQRKEFKDRYKNLMKTYNDDTVVLVDGEDLTDAQEIDMRNSMLHTILMLLGVCYMKLNHYALANQAIEESIKIYDKSTQLFYRKSQTISYNKWSTLEELEKAKKDIENAIEMKKYEKIFTESQPGILKIMNLHNHEEAYKEQAVHCVQRIYDRKKWELERVNYVFSREKRMQQIYQQMIEDGKTPKPLDEFQEKDEFDDKMEMMIINEMVKKYYKAIEFYTEQKDDRQVDAAKYQLQNLLETVQEMVYYFELDFNSWSAQEGNKEFQFDLKDEKQLRRLNRIKKEKAKEIFDTCQSFNFQIFKWALDDVMKARKEYLDAKEEEDKDTSDTKKKSLAPIFTQPQFFAQLILVIATVFFLGLIFRDTDSIYKLYNSVISSKSLE